MKALISTAAALVVVLAALPVTIISGARLRSHGADASSVDYLW